MKAVDTWHQVLLVADAKPISCHSHQRSGALDFDAFLLTADDEGQRACSDQENKSAPLQVCCAVLCPPDIVPCLSSAQQQPLPCLTARNKSKILVLSLIHI